MADACSVMASRFTLLYCPLLLVPLLVGAAGLGWVSFFCSGSVPTTGKSKNSYCRTALGGRKAKRMANYS